MLKRVIQQGRRRRTAPEAYPCGYVEESCEPRTPLVTRFSIRLKKPLAAEKERPRHPRMRHSQPDAAFSLIDVILLIQ